MYSMSDKTRSYCFTINNYTADEVKALNECECKYIVYGKEVGDGGTPHLQGFVSFHNPRTIRGMKREKCWARAHLEVAMKPMSAIDYCKKGKQAHSEWEKEGVKGAQYGLDADIYERGAYEQGKRNDLAEAYEAIKNGESVDELIWRDPNSYTFASKTLERLEDVRLRKLRRSEMTQGVWVFGETGVGKSDWAFEEGGTSVYIYPYDGDWWDAYKCEECVIIDEFRGQIPYNGLLRMVDKHPNYFVRRRGREPMPFVSKKVIVTSSLPPWKVFKNLDQQDSLNQLFRRFKIFKKTKEGQELIDPETYVEELDGYHLTGLQTS